MKHTFLMMMAALLIALGGVKDMRVLVMTPTPAMHCNSCENKIKNNLRFEKGVVKIETDLEKQTVTVTYSAAKTSVEKLQAAMKAIGYDTKVVSDKPQEKPQRKKAHKQ